ncbi:hypothetical protein HOY80DRAFT_981822 [Tuber brumale]|nr:hypothetical protein HOY80DRAFT_981822 [Tuber brumale]
MYLEDVTSYRSISVVLLFTGHTAAQLLGTREALPTPSGFKGECFFNIFLEVSEGYQAGLGWKIVSRKGLPRLNISVFEFQ